MIAGAAAAGLILAGGGTTSAAGAAGSLTAMQAAAGCVIDPAKAHENVKIRKSPTVNSTALGLLPKGAKARYVTCGVKLAAAYSLCGWKDDNRWSYITYRGIKGYVPLACVV
ncbi:SH3 domain-containing protein [Streptomyces sp. NPDC059970]|uniref:SH3 domain-containing protein n=1 Tax=Streptomyces sp. NPDC059970 TaxID=3347019 RepID=UPI0036C69488